MLTKSRTQPTQIQGDQLVIDLLTRTKTSVEGNIILTFHNELGSMSNYVIKIIYIRHVGENKIEKIRVNEECIQQKPTSNGQVLD